MEIAKLCSIINQMKAKMNREHESGKVKAKSDFVVVFQTWLAGFRSRYAPI